MANVRKVEMVEFTTTQSLGSKCESGFWPETGSTLAHFTLEELMLLQVTIAQEMRNRLLAAAADKE